MLRKDLSSIPTAEYKEPKDEKSKPLLIGFANSMFQASGTICGHSNWTDAAARRTVPDADLSIEHWDKFEADLDQMVKMGVNSYRFSIEWSQVEYGPGKYSDEVIAQYAKRIAACKQRGIEPMITLFHFTEPSWFTKLGGFEKVENIQYFVRFCEKMFTHFNKDVRYWCTINEPAIHAFVGYFLGQFPPHRSNLSQTIDVLTNLLIAHTYVYKTLKNLPGGEAAQIGIVHNVLKFIPKHNHQRIEKAVTGFLTTLSNDIVMNYLKTGRVDYQMTWAVDKHYHDPSAVNAFDFFGLNFYANPMIGFNTSNFFGPTHFPDQIVGDYDLHIDPKGFASAIDEVAALKKPVMITETGIADSKDAVREKFLKEYLEVFKQKRSEGVDLRGFYHWTFADNYEWKEGYTKSFGLFDRHRRKRDSAKIFEEFMKESLPKHEKETPAECKRL